MHPSIIRKDVPLSPPFKKSSYITFACFHEKTGRCMNHKQTNKQNSDARKSAVLTLQPPATSALSPPLPLLLLLPQPQPQPLPRPPVSSPAVFFASSLASFHHGVPPHWSYGYAAPSQGMSGVSVQDMMRVSDDVATLRAEAPQMRQHMDGVTAGINQRLDRIEMAMANIVLKCKDTIKS